MRKKEAGNRSERFWDLTFTWGGLPSERCARELTAPHDSCTSVRAALSAEKPKYTLKAQLSSWWHSPLKTTHIPLFRTEDNQFSSNLLMTWWDTDNKAVSHIFKSRDHPAQSTWSHTNLTFPNEGKFMSSCTVNYGNNSPMKTSHASVKDVPGKGKKRWQNETAALLIHDIHDRSDSDQWRRSCYGNPAHSYPK